MATDSSSDPVVVLDVETTGLGRHDRIVEIAVVTLDPATLEITDEYDTLVNPERDVGPAGLHGITASMVEAAPVFEEIVAALSRRLHGGVLAAHNLQFNVRMLGSEFERMDVAFSPGAGVCTYKITRKKLGAACDMLGVALEHQHRALADARATAQVLRRVTAPPFIATTAAIGYVPQALSTRTLRREGADAGVSDLARVVSHASYPFSDEALLQYLDALDWVLDDHEIDDEEHEAIRTLAKELGISARQREQAHRSYLAAIVAAAERDGIVTEAEQRMIGQVADALEIGDSPAPTPRVTDVASAATLRSGMRVCFTREATADDPFLTRSVLEEWAACAGLQPVGSVTKQGCDLLVTASVPAPSKAVFAARRAGVPMMAVEDFIRDLGFDDA